MLRNERTDQGGKSTRCRVCGHPDRYRYDKAIALGTKTRSEVAKEIGLHRSSVARHCARHVESSVAEQLANDPELSATKIVEEIKRLYLLTEEGRRTAVAKGDLHAVRGFLRDQKALLELVVKLSERADYQPAIDPATNAEEQRERAAEVRETLARRIDEIARRRERSQSGTSIGRAEGEV